MVKKEFDTGSSWKGTIKDPKVYGELIKGVRSSGQGLAAEELVRRLLGSTQLRHELSRLDEGDATFQKITIVQELLKVEVGDVLAQAGRTYRTRPQELQEELTKRVETLGQYGYLRPARAIIQELESREEAG